MRRDTPFDHRHLSRRIARENASVTFFTSRSPSFAPRSIAESRPAARIAHDQPGPTKDTNLGTRFIDAFRSAMAQHFDRSLLQDSRRSSPFDPARTFVLAIRSAIFINSAGPTATPNRRGRARATSAAATIRSARIAGRPVERRRSLPDPTYKLASNPLTGSPNFTASNDLLGTGEADALAAI